MKREITYTDQGVKLCRAEDWKYCDRCGFCHGDDFKRCLKQKKQRR